MSPPNTAHTRCPINVNDALPHQTRLLHQQPMPRQRHRQPPTCHVTIDKGCHATHPTAITDKGTRWGVRARMKAVRTVTARGPCRGGEVYRVSTMITITSLFLPHVCYNLVILSSYGLFFTSTQLCALPPSLFFVIAHSAIHAFLIS